jgi:hypothetical protein
MLDPKPIPHASMERSGFWRTPEPNGILESPAGRQQSEADRERAAAYLDPLTLRRMKHANPIDAENGGAGPRWGSTTNRATFTEHPTALDRFRTTDWQLVGAKDATSYTHQRVFVPEEPVTDSVSTTQASYVKPARDREITIPNRTVMDKSGFQTAAIPTKTENVPMADHSPSDLPATVVAELKKKNTPEYQNLYEPNPYKSTQQISYTAPGPRAYTTDMGWRRGPTGYLMNSRVIAGAPGDPRYHRTGESTTAASFGDPEAKRERNLGQVPNVVERSGYWAK